MTVQRTMRCYTFGCGNKTPVDMSTTQAECLKDAIECGARGDGWDLYQELMDELKPLCYKCEEILEVNNG